jgi:hypothetical protein
MAAMEFIQTADKTGSFSRLDITPPMYTMAHRLLRIGRISISRSAVSNGEPQSSLPVLHPKDALAAPADTLIPDWGTA